MKKIILIAIISLIFAYYSSIVFSLYNFHKAIFFKNENLIKKYINFKTLKINLKENIENTIKSEIEKDKTLDPATKLLTYNLASNFSEILISNYINSKDITLLLNKTIKDEIPKPNLAKTYLVIIKLNFNSWNEIYINYERNNEKIPVIFKRDMFIWRLAGIKFNSDQIKRIIK
tara:strand:- start:476 stop:997 length:522 start_codon:yes stop_codon:yes gene_type:complete